MKIGSLYFDIDRNKILEPEEIVDIIFEKPEASLFAGILLNNNDYFSTVPILGTPIKNKDNKTFRVVLDECYNDHSDAFANSLKTMLDEDFEIRDLPDEFFDIRNEDNILIRLVQENDDEYFVQFAYFDDEDDEYHENAAKQDLLKLFKTAKVDSFKKVLNLVNEARDILKKCGFEEDLFNFDELEKSF